MDYSAFSSGDEFKKLVSNRLKNFWGYGSLKSPTWFIGMEEGLGDGIDHLKKRFISADGKMTVDMRRDMQEVPDHIRWFRGNPSIQSTWKYNIALYLYLRNSRIPSTDEIRAYQALRLGDNEIKETAAIELMPLPATKANQNSWIYGNLGIIGLSTRTEYLKIYKSERVRTLRKLFDQYEPKLAIFYSLTYLPDWKEVIGASPKEITEGMYFSRTNKTICLIIPQGASFGMSYARIYEFVNKVHDMGAFLDHYPLSS